MEHSPGSILLDNDERPIEIQAVKEAGMNLASAE